MTGSSFPMLDHVAYFAPLPLLLLDAGRRLCDFNLALQVLMGDDANGWRGRSVAEWCKHIGPRLGDTEGLFGGPDKAVRTGEVSYKSPDFGLAKLRWAAIISLDPILGEQAGTTVYLEVLELGAGESYRAAVRRLWERQRLWEEYAVSYDKVLLEMPYYHEVLDRHFRALAADGIRTVLDIGAGTGTLALRLLDAGKDVTAVDNSRAMLGKLRSRQTADHPRLRILEQNAESLPQFANGAFDGVNLLLTLFDMNKPKAALDEALRLVRPGGVLVATEPKRNFRMAPILDFCEAELKRRGLFESLAADLYRVTQVNRTFDPSARPSQDRVWAETIYETLGAKGFRDLDLTDSHFGNCATVHGRKP